MSRERHPGRAAKRQPADGAASGIEQPALCDQPPRVEKIISGGQTGVDRAALDVALAMGIDCGGWCPKGRRAEDGSIPSRYPLAETASPAYSQRTKRNVRDSDATLILSRGQPRGGTLLTKRTAVELGKPCLAIDLGAPVALAEIREWLGRHAVRVLNIAGPRESQSPGITLEATRLLHELFAARRTVPKTMRTRGSKSRRQSL
ncbi:MAG TPA: putative molybdenum carrier protein [Planctomycetaceae bacterium]|nr:putative molybdenum carrier protein [Planctomycetaceae bacterium]